MSRIPGSLGLSMQRGQMIPHRGPLCGFLPFSAADTPAVTPGPTGINDKAAAKANGKTEAKKDAKTTEEKNAETELDLLRRLYGTMKNSSNTKAYFSKVKKDKKTVWVYDTKEYIKDRKAFFGSTKDYEDYKKKANEDLDADNEKLRRYVDPPKAVRKKHVDWKNGQAVFYAWVKKKFEKDHGTKSEYSKIIKAQKSDKLKKALATVKKDYGKSFASGGFNPRPIKRPGGIYLLGTISEHAVGNAIDIESTKNPQIDTWRWNRIVAYTGKKASRSDLRTKWKSKDQKRAKEAYDAVKALNDEWVSKLEKAVKKLEEDAKKKAGAPKAAPKVDYLDRVIDADENLKRLKKQWVKKWKDGFFSLEWALVKELHEEAFDWGVHFNPPDLHHFEL